ncbi:hypothetical protein L484_002443 [Morus notabilis]|uniref:Uncharacterized protein n=1 Tax=Morus notabilis TaxID=981085 RepID=W9RSP1_9ROSA|nr:hypothetical protein L484_002443 [Morus notabilis]
MYSRFAFPGFIKSTSRKKSVGRENLDQGSVSDVKDNRCVIVPVSVTMVAKTLEKKDNNWIAQSTAASDLIVQVGGSNFHLHKVS